MPLLYVLDRRRPSAVHALLDTVVSVGRDPANRVVLTDPSVSRFHFVLFQCGSDYLIRDAGSRYGTFLNGRRLSGDVLLRSGSSIAAGTRRLLYCGTDSAGPTPPRGKQSVRVGIWWRLSCSRLAFGWKIRRR